MKRRVLAAAVAVLLATLGGVLVLGYVSAADQRALAGVQTVDVLVVTATVPAGTPAEELDELVSVESLPAVAVAPGALAGLAEVAGLVTGTDLLPGEQLLAARFVDPAAQPQTAQVEVPEGLQQVSVLLEAQRVVGGNLSAGDTVGVLLSVDKKTHLTLQKVLVTRVQGAAAPVQDEAEDGAAADALPESSLMVTLALEAGQAEQVVFTAEHGTIWLSLQDEATDESGTDVVTAESVHR